MKTTQRSLTTFLLLALPLTAACGTKSLHEVTDRATNTPYSSSARPASAQAGHVENVMMGKKVSADGTILADDQANKFAPGEPIYITMQVGTAFAGSPIKVAWYDANNQKVGEDQKTIAKHETQVSLQAKNASSWPAGDYRAEVWMGDQKVSTQQFTIADRSS
jgi:hypothetical protein